VVTIHFTNLSVLNLAHVRIPGKQLNHSEQSLYFSPFQISIVATNRIPGWGDTAAGSAYNISRVRVGPIGDVRVAAKLPCGVVNRETSRILDGVDDGGVGRHGDLGERL
jgi:hypothetical protein